MIVVGLAPVATDDADEEGADEDALLLEAELPAELLPLLVAADELEELWREDEAVGTLLDDAAG